MGKKCGLKKEEGKQKKDIVKWIVISDVVTIGKIQTRKEQVILQ